LGPSTLATAYKELIASTVSLAQDRISLADAFNAGVVDKLKSIEASNEDIKKKVVFLLIHLLLSHSSPGNVILSKACRRKGTKE
jgi:PIN domain nuclease of toxin-antitoxin system